MRIHAYIGDITETDTAAVVNAACLSLEGGGGVDGAVHRAAGPELLKACKELPVVEYSDNEGELIKPIRCPTGEARTTPAFDLLNHYVIHTTGPRYEEQGANAPELLRCCYANSLWEAINHDCTSIAFPAISTGIFGYPLEAATIIAVDTVMSMSAELPSSFVVEFVCFDVANFLVYNNVIKAAESGYRARLEVR